MDIIPQSYLIEIGLWKIISELRQFFFLALQFLAFYVKLWWNSIII